MEIKYGEMERYINMIFFSPSAELKELKLLKFIEEKPITSQQEIAKIIGSAASMVNVYMDKFEDKGYLVRDYKSLKVVHYNITPKGIKRKNYLSINYLNELILLYRLAEENIEIFLKKLEGKGYKEILFYGAGEVAETILKVAKKYAQGFLKIVALVDDDSDLVGKEMLGVPIIAREEIINYSHDAMVITSYTYEDEIIGRLREIGYEEGKVERFFGV